MGAFLGLLIFLAPEVVLKWNVPQRNTITVSVDDKKGWAERCVRSGFEARYRYQFKLCENRTTWFGRCENTRTIIKSMEIDPISELYRVKSDQIGDKLDPVTKLVNDREEAWSELASIRSLPLMQLGGEQLRRDKENFYTSVRVTGDCKGDYNQTLDRIGSVLTLGLLQFNKSDSGWVSFTFEKR